MQETENQENMMSWKLKMVRSIQLGTEKFSS